MLGAKVILKRIQLEMEQVKTTEPVFKPDTESTTTASGDTPSPTQASFDVEDPVKDKETKEKNDIGWETGTCPGADEPSITSKSLALLKRFKISEGFFSLKTLLELALARLSAATSEWQPFSAAHLEKVSNLFSPLSFVVYCASDRGCCFYFILLMLDFDKHYLLYECFAMRYHMWFFFVPI
jgi:hypothetical protein